MRKAELKPQVIEKRMPCLRSKDNGRDVFRENEIRMKGAVKDEIEMMFRMLGRNPFQRFKSKPADPFQLVFDQEARVYSYVHGRPGK